MGRCPQPGWRALSTSCVRRERGARARHAQVDRLVDRTRTVLRPRPLRAQPARQHAVVQVAKRAAAPFLGRQCLVGQTRSDGATQSGHDHGPLRGAAQEARETLVVARAHDAAVEHARGEPLSRSA